MFSDEIETVRLHSINSIIKIKKEFEINQEQLLIVSDILKDYSPIVRHSIHELLSLIKLPNFHCLKGFFYK
jgi:hypothetical protein